ncbi:hypothetical protein HNQ60_001429 [Povalibacter uvarum]|uniref:DUF4124 domain-containing protein n=1 Tax=Povalibacter uvarum TaxID=732238 RepID=A0A841HHC4_9GAMM|nr:DUF4124 domain-containing protein [Povalibacter uvarum]MBB6092551.1 hypothetical protein [Povalibacter uvarum]
MSIVRLLCLSALIAATLPAGVVMAASSTTREAFYRCKDGAGQVHYGDSKPKECEGLDTEVLNNNGMVVRVIEGTQSKVAREQREVGEKRIRAERDARLQRDRMLMETYLTVEDIERLRDQRLELLDSQYRVNEQNITNLRNSQSRLAQQIARFKPYSDKANAPPLPDHLAEEMVNTVNNMRVYQEMLEKTRKEQSEIKTTFTADIARFKELKGIK